MRRRRSATRPSKARPAARGRGALPVGFAVKWGATFCGPKVAFFGQIGCLSLFLVFLFSCFPLRKPASNGLRFCQKGRFCGSEGEVLRVRWGAFAGHVGVLY